MQSSLIHRGVEAKPRTLTDGPLTFHMFASIAELGQDLRVQRSLAGLLVGPNSILDVVETKTLDLLLDQSQDYCVRPGPSANQRA